MTILQTILTLAGLPAHQTRVLHALLSVWLAIPGRLNATNSSRCSGWSEKTVRRWFHRPLPWLNKSFQALGGWRSRRPQGE